MEEESKVVEYGVNIGLPGRDPVITEIKEDGTLNVILNDETPEQAAANKRKWTPPKKFNNIEEYLAATLDVRTRAESLLVDIQAIHRSSEDIIGSIAEDGKRVMELELENSELKGKLTKLKEAMSAI